MRNFALLIAFTLTSPLVFAGAHIDLVCQAGGRIAGYIKVENADSTTGKIKMGYVPETVFLVNYTDDGVRFIMKSNDAIQRDLDGEGWARLFDY